MQLYYPVNFRKLNNLLNDFTVLYNYHLPVKIHLIHFFLKTQLSYY